MKIIIKPKNQGVMVTADGNNLIYCNVSNINTIIKDKKIKCL